MPFLLLEQKCGTALHYFAVAMTFLTMADIPWCDYHAPPQYGGPCNSFKCLGHLKNLMMMMMMMRCWCSDLPVSMVNLAPSRPNRLSAGRGHRASTRDCSLLPSYRHTSWFVTCIRHSPCAERFGVGNKYTWNIAAHNSPRHLITYLHTTSILSLVAFPGHESKLHIL